MAVPEDTKSSFQSTDVWDSLFEMEAVAGIDGAVRAASICARCKCSHGCSSLTIDKEFLGAQFLSASVPVATTKEGRAVRNTLEQIDGIKRVIKTHSDTFEIAHTASDVDRINKDGKFALLLGVEGGHSFDNSPGVLRMFHELGARYVTLTSEDILDFKDPSTESLVKEMNRLAMLVDISELPSETVKHLMRTSRAPLIASNVTGVGRAASSRTMAGDIVDLVRKSGGVVMVNFYSTFLSPEEALARKASLDVARELRRRYPDSQEYRAALDQRKPADQIRSGSLREVGDHIENLINMAGIDHVGLATDSDGINPLPEQIQHSSIFRITREELRNRGYSGESIHKVFSGNVMRVFQEAERVAGR
jgi:membrane dipeptidase